MHRATIRLDPGKGTLLLSLIYLGAVRLPAVSSARSTRRCSGGRLCRGCLINRDRVKGPRIGPNHSIGLCRLVAGIAKLRQTAQQDEGVPKRVQRSILIAQCRFS